MNETRLQPLGTRVLCRRLLTEETVPGGRIILLPDRLEADTNQQAEVVAAGASCDPALVPGAWVVHTAHARSEAPDDMFWILEDNIVAIIT